VAMAAAMARAAAAMARVAAAMARVAVHNVSSNKLCRRLNCEEGNIPRSTSSNCRHTPPRRGQY
jgi:hypothetical protein